MLRAHCGRHVYQVGGIFLLPYSSTSDLGWSEKHKSWKMQKARADSKSRHTTDFRTVFEIMIGRFVSCEIGQTYFTESGVRFGTLERPDFRSFS